MKKFLILLLCSLFLATIGHAEDVIDDIEEEERTEVDPANNAPQLYNEAIKSISNSKKIFVISNDNQAIYRGDYISILLNNQLVCRALVAKTTDSKMAGIKIVKIYNSTLWTQLGINKEVLILRGDDSYYTLKKTAQANDDKKKKGDDDLKISSEEDLFNNTTAVDDDLNLEENNNRLIKPDNILGLNYGLLESLDNAGASYRYPHINANWGYQLSDNVWGEIGVGTNTITDYPNVNGAGGIDTRLISFNFRLKYTINAPFYSYIMPYAGYQIVSADSPGAGKDDPNDPQSQSDLAKELELVDALKKSGPVFGVTILRRVVPGWFVRADLGTDLIGGGLTLEF